MSVLHRILEAKREQVERSAAQVPLKQLLELLDLAPTVRSFARAIKRTNGIKLIAELKRSSPSAGIIREQFEPKELLSIYEASPAAAISVLTEENFFGGHIEHLRLAKEVTSKPVLRKDFILCEYQVVEARAYGADAVLLIVSALETHQLRKLISLTREYGMDALVEVHDEAEVDIALSCGANIIGVNNRDLKTMQVDISTTLRLRKLIPDGIIVISESGIRCREDARLLEDAGVDAMLVGEALMRSGDPIAKMNELLGLNLYGE
ncbi:MAG: indole-3-glycerol phosphate synthase TrpC [Armatimonadota bacterium]|nr:indole-3-glycerol phosphate synthase TrpC [Armatimonadota bacterium]MCX7777776.1 indole-3-glycerol phosphate synthase TrpC [Armatimonadota bacterium]MDW8025337.1 indole-3-glycerol phosphate synthase TrpC [Armatimonadota bacterium]